MVPQNVFSAFSTRTFAFFHVFLAVKKHICHSLCAYLFLVFWCNFGALFIPICFVWFRQSGCSNDAYYFYKTSFVHFSVLRVKQILKLSIFLSVIISVHVPYDAYIQYQYMLCCMTYKKVLIIIYVLTIAIAIYINTIYPSSGDSNIFAQFVRDKNR